MALASHAATSLQAQPHPSHSLSSSRNTSSPSVLPVSHRRRAASISAVHAADPSRNPSVVEKPKPASSPLPAQTAKWSIESWKSKKALQLPEYPDKKDLEAVLKTIESFPPIVFAGEARHLEEKLADAAMGRAFLLQGGDCAESFKEFNANNIRDTFRVLLQMSAVLMFGGQMPVVKVFPLFFISFLFSFFWLPS